MCSSDLCLQGACVHAWNKLATRTMLVAAAGVPNGGTLRVCSNAPGLSGDPCATGSGYKVVASASVQNQAATVVIGNLPDGVYTFMAEASSLPIVPWTGSLATGTTGKSRQILIDTVAPTITALQPPTAAGVPAGCLSDKVQDQSDVGLPGGKFSFTATVDEDSAVVLQADKLEVGKQFTSGKTAKIAVSLPNEGTVVFSAVPVDLAGNIGKSAVADLSLSVNTVAPAGNFAQPSKAKLLAGDSLDVKVVSAAADVEGQLVTLNDVGLPLAAQAPMVGGAALFPQATTNALSDGQHSLTAKLLDVCANQTTIATIPQTITVDTKPPVLTWVAPADKAKFVDADDASPAGGYQVSAQFDSKSSYPPYDAPKSFFSQPTDAPVSAPQIGRAHV